MSGFEPTNDCDMLKNTRQKKNFQATSNLCSISMMLTGAALFSQ